MPGFGRTKAISRRAVRTGVERRANDRFLKTEDPDNDNQPAKLHIYKKKLVPKRPKVERTESKEFIPEPDPQKIEEQPVRKSKSLIIVEVQVTYHIQDEGKSIELTVDSEKGKFNIREPLDWFLTEQAENITSELMKKLNLGLECQAFLCSHICRVLLQQVVFERSSERRRS